MSRLHWYVANMPYPWATTFHPFVGVSSPDKVLREIVWQRSPGEWVRIHVAMVDWNVSQNPDFARMAPPNKIPRPPRFVEEK